MGINKIILIGNLGKDPDIKTLQNDNKVANFSIAIYETYKDKSGEKQTSTEWVNCVVWGKLASVVEKYLKKGSKVYIEGKLKTDSYEKDGQTRYSTKVNVFSLEMLGGKTDKSNNSQISNTSADPQDLEPTDDLPFN